MQEMGFSGRETRMSSKSAQEIADKIVRDAEARESNVSDVHRAVQGRETTSSYLGMTRKDAPPIPDSEPTSALASASRSFAVAGDDPAPPSAALGVPTLVKEKESRSEHIEEAGRSVIEPHTSEKEPTKEDIKSREDSDVYVSSGLGLPLLSENPTPLSSALHIPTLINESKTSPQR